MTGQCSQDEQNAAIQKHEVEQQINQTQASADVETGRVLKDDIAFTEQRNDLPEPPYSAFSRPMRMTAVLVVSFVAMISPLSGSIYLPATSSLASDLNVSDSKIQLTITTYQILQGIAPSFIANFSDSYGRRPAYLLCFIIYLCANLGLALQDSYPALMVLRCLQSAGSSATVAMGSAASADLVTRAERGKFIGYASMGITLGPALGPVLGGIFDSYLGWRWIFWFLMIFSVALLSVYWALIPETARSVVGNGSILPPRWTMTPRQHLQLLRGTLTENAEDRKTVKQARRRPNPFAALKILGEKEGGITLGFGSLMYAGYFMMLTTLSLQLTQRFGFSAVQTGLCYLPLSIGSIASRWTCGFLIDWNFRRHARLAGIELVDNKQQNMNELPIEKMRLQITIPMVYISCGTVLAYGWTMQSQASLAGIEVSLFFLGLFLSGGLNALNTLVIDTHSESPATASAANNLFRCLMSAGGTAIAVPLIDRIGIGLTSVFISAVWCAFTPLLWLVYFRGEKWRRDKEDKKKQAMTALVVTGRDEQEEPTANNEVSKG
ncbi:major facilitator superfamily domain-containing protein [Xylariales sp. PMI_506]|nr:major facilitator superfamily domain-containing protein [Xylariales sp. PMI_506]